MAGKKLLLPRLYEVLGLLVLLLVKGQMLACDDVGDGGLGGRMLSDLNAEMADEYCAPVVAPGVVGGEKCIEFGLEGDARGTMSLGSGLHAA